MSKYQVVALSVTIKLKNSKNSAFQTNLSLSDSREFISLYQGSDMIKINPDEWPLIRSAINKLMRLCE